MNQVVNKIRELIEYLNYHTKCYDEGHPEISDTEWDKAYFELDQLEKEYSIYFNNSPTQSISYEVVNSLEKVVHSHDMLSLEKTKALSEVKNFLGNVPYIAMCKMDGLTCSLRYEDGKLVAAETRGNGKTGENILHNAKVIPSIPKQIPITRTMVLDGEIICTKEDFKEFENNYENPRNFAAGSIRLLDSNECSKRKLKFVLWDVIEGLEDEKYLSEKLSIMSTCGFMIVPFTRGPSIVETEKTFKTIDEIVEDLVQLAKDFPIDGIVFKYDDVPYGRSLGQTSHHFKNALAFKFADDTVKSNLTGIDWTMGRTGVLTPVAEFNEIYLEGSTVCRASLHNLSVLWDTLGEKPYINQEVEVFKANMIIPQIKSAVMFEDCEDEVIYLINIPDKCPICGKPTIQRTDLFSTFLVCENPSCEGKLINRLDHFCGKKGLDIKGLSKATLEKLIDWGWVSNYKDLFELKNHRAEWIKMPGFGVKSVDNILNAIESGRVCDLPPFIAALGIPLIGTTASKEIVKVFPTWDSFMSAVETHYHFWDIPNFGYEMHSAITRFDYTEAKELYNNYLTINTVQPQPSEVENTLDGLSLVITGKLNHFKNRDELKAVIEARGGKVAGSISGKTSYLINNDVNSTSSKNASAKKLGVPIISEDAFIEMFGIS
jgi:DNA ligase (NAD+)